MPSTTGIHGALAAAGLSAKARTQLRALQTAGDIRGQLRLLDRCCCAQQARLQAKRRQLACLDYLIATLEAEHKP